MENHETHMVYALTAEQRAEIEEQGGELPAVLTVHASSVPRMESEGFVVCDADGNPGVVSPDRGDEASTTGPDGFGVLESGDEPGIGGVL